MDIMISAFDISKYLTCDGTTENVISVKVVHQTPSSRWYSGSGIYRDVELIVTDAVHVSRNGTYVTTPNLATEKTAMLPLKYRPMSRMTAVHRQQPRSAQQSWMQRAKQFLRQ